jgi:hypothetical protein
MFLSSKSADWHPPMLAPAPGVSPVVPLTPHATGGIFTRPHIGLVAERGPEAIIPLGGGGAITVNAPITINGSAAEHGDLTAILTEHAQAIAREVQRILAIQYEQEAVV